MTRRKAIITLEGNDRKQENAIHQLKKFVAEANREAELDATIQSERIEATETDVDVEQAFERAGQ
jgi:hypothetical protein